MERVFLLKYLIYVCITFQKWIRNGLYPFDCPTPVFTLSCALELVHVSVYCRPTWYILQLCYVYYTLFKHSPVNCTFRLCPAYLVAIIKFTSSYTCASIYTGCYIPTLEILDPNIYPNIDIISVLYSISLMFLILKMFGRFSNFLR